LTRDVEHSAIGPSDFKEALSIKDPEANRLVRELASHAGESLTEAVIIALRECERLERAKRARPTALEDEIVPNWSRMRRAAGTRRAYS
jgi:hypothetical protein